jgi:ATP-dependent Clp protease ATP-binding subunit ClpA
MNQPIQTVVTHATKATAHPSLREIGSMMLKIPGTMLKTIVGQDEFTKKVVSESHAARAAGKQY